MNRKLTCIVCPMGCELSVEMEGEKVLSVAGNTCPRGKSYAETECTNPVRCVTSTVRCTNGAIVSVKTEQPIPKSCVMACMELINRAKPDLPIAVGDVIIEDAFGSRVIATQNMEVK